LITGIAYYVSNRRIPILQPGYFSLLTNITTYPKKKPLLKPRSSATPEQAFMKLKHYCGYQERCHSEVKEKLYSLGLCKSDVEQLISRLIEEGYLNEERFAQQFAGGYFRQKKWGVNKIVYALRQKKLSEYTIKKGLKEIDREEYAVVAEKLIRTKWTALKDEQYMNREAKTMTYLQQKGYEPALVQSILKKIRSESTR
jgi:regulatory protein